MIRQGDVREQLVTLPAESVHCVITSPPYWNLRDYGIPGQLGLEPTPEEYLVNMVAVFREVRRVLRKDGTLWLNMGDSYAGGGSGGGGSFAKDGIRAAKPGTDKNVPARHGNRGASGVLKPKDLIGMPWRLALTLQADGWWLRCDIIWAKSNPMPESVTDRPASSHEYIFLLTRSAKYFYDAEAVREPGSAPSKMPDGWATHEGGHGSFHRDGREKGAKVKNAGRNNAIDNPRTPNPKKKQDALGNPTHVGFNDRYADNPIAGRNLRSVWTIATQPYHDAHFATFPEALVKRCILAGTSAKGCCSECGAPWARVVEKEFHAQDDVSPERGMRKAAGSKSMEHRKDGDTPRGTNDTTTIGWRPTCNHAGEPIPATVLDCFLGSGTTGKVAQELGREWIGIELSEEYCELARRRTGSQMGLRLA